MKQLTRYSITAILVLFLLLSPIFASPASAAADDLLVSGIKTPSEANGTYVLTGTHSGYNYWSRTAGSTTYVIYNDVYSKDGGTTRYWNLDTNFDDEGTSGVVLFFSSASTSTIPLELSWNPDMGTGSLNIVRGTPSAEIAVLGNGNAIVDGTTLILSSNNTNIGSANISGGTASRTFTINNSGSAVLTLSDASPYVTISGTNASSFSVTTAPSPSIAASSGTTTFVITFTPLTQGYHNAVVTINNNDPDDESVYTFNIQGYGYVAQSLIISGITEPTAANGTYIHQGILNNFQFWKHESENYYLYFDTFGAGGFWDLDSDTDDANALFFKASEEGTPVDLTGWTLTTSGYTPLPTGNPVISYAILAAEINVKGNSTSIVLNDITPSFEDQTMFGSVDIAGGSRMRTYTIENTGGVALTLSGVSLGGTNASEFSKTNPVLTTVPASGSTTFSVTFDPSSEGTKTATVSIASNDADENPYVFTISGDAFTPKNLTISDITIPAAANGIYLHQGIRNEFQNWKHESQNYYIYNDIYNTTDYYWNFDINFDDTDNNYLFYSSSIAAAPIGLSTWTENKTAGFISSGVPNIEYAGPEMDVKGNGNSIPDGSSSPTTTNYSDFGSVSVASGSVSHTFTINNTSGSVLNLSGTPIVALSGTNSSDFSVSAQPTTPVAATTGSTTFTIVFDPSGGGTRSATISIANDDSDENPYNFNIQGTGLVAPTLTTSTASPVATTTATLGGNITSDGGVTVTERGVVYSSTDATPTIGETDVTQNTNGSGTGLFSESIGSLSLATHYYFQAYATNTQGTSYGGVQEFTTLNTVLSILRNGSNPTNASSVSWDVKFGASVTDLTSANFTLVNTGLTGPTISGVSSSVGTDWTVTTSTGTGAGTLGLNLTSITGLNAGLSNTPFTGEVFTVDMIAPMVSSIVRQSPSSDPTNADILVFRVTFNEAVTSVDANNFIATGTTTPLSASVNTVTPNLVFDFTVDSAGGGDLSSFNGTVGLNIVSSPTIKDLAGNSLQVIEPTPAATKDQTYTLDNIAPTVTINQAVGQTDPTNASPINFTVVFSESVGTSFVTGDVTLTSTTGASAAVTEITPNDGTTYNVAVSGMTSNGTVTASIAGSKGQDAAGNNNIASTSSDHIVTYILPTNLSITLTDGVTTAVPGESVTYTITVSNAGPNNDPSATVADTFPASLTTTWTCVGAGGGTCTASGSGNINDTANLPVGSSVTYTVTAAISASATGTLSNTASVSSSISDTAPGNNSATDADTLTSQADLSITKTDGVTVAVPGGSVTYTITASNAGPSNVTGATVADTFPASLTATWTCLGAGGGTCTASGSGNLNNTVNLPAGGSVTYSVTASINAAASGTLSNTATVTMPAGVTDPTPGNNSATDADTLTAQADLSITKTDGVTAAVPGGSVTYTITASNAGPSDVTGATVADTFPASLTATWSCVSAGGGTCSASGSGNINDTVNLPAGGSVTYTANATVSLAATGSVSNSATLTAPAGVTDPTPGNNSATDTDSVIPAVEVTINQTSGQADPTNASPINFTVVFASTVTGFGNSDITLSGSAGATTATVTGSGTTYNVAVSGMTSAGTVTASIPSGVVSGGSGEPNAASTSTDNSVFYDAAGPDTTITNDPFPSRFTNTTSTSFNFTGDDGTGVGSLTFECKLDLASFAACNSGIFNILSVAEGSHTFQVRANDNLGNSDPTPASYTWTVYTTGPTVASITTTATNHTNISPVPVTITFVNPVCGFDSTTGVDLNVTNGVTSALTSGSNGSKVYTFDLTPSSQGLVSLYLKSGTVYDGDCITPLNYNSADSASFSITYDTIAPTVTIEQKTDQVDPSGTTPVNFTATFNEDVTGLTDTEIDLSTSTAPGTLSAAITGGPTIFNIAVSGMTGDGTVIASITALAAQDAANNGNDLSTSVDNTVAYIYSASPVITEGDSLNITISENNSPTPFTLTLNATDTNADPLTWSIQTPASHGTAGAVAGPGASSVITYVPSTNYTGADTFVVQVSDGKGGTDSININVTIQAPTTVSKINSVANTGDGLIDEAEHTTAAIKQLLVVFNNNMDAIDAQNIANYNLVQNVSTPVTINSIIYDDPSRTATLNLNNGIDLLEGKYTLTVKGLIKDALGNLIGTDFVRIFYIDTTEILVKADGVTLPNGIALINGGTLYTTFSEIMVAFDEDAANPDGDTEPDDVTNPANYLLVSPGANAAFDTLTCLAGLGGDDVAIPTGPVIYNNGGGSGPFISKVSVNNGTVLENGIYRLFVCGTTSITDLAGNHLFGNTDHQLSFSILSLSGSGGGPKIGNPATGFAPAIYTALPLQPAEKSYADLGDLWIEIPSLGVKASITGVPLAPQGWDLTWLHSQVGWLEGTAYPTWNGNTVLTAHAFTSDGLPGPFALIKNLKYGDTFAIHLNSQKYNYTVRSRSLVKANDTTQLTKHEELDWVTLITCQQFDEKSKTYLKRWVVRAVLTSVQTDD